MPDSSSDAAGSEDFASRFNVSRETIHRLERYAAILEDWQSWTNLVARSTLPDLWSRHFADSAQLTLLAPDARLWLDLGSGAGFPGLVVAILMAHEPGFAMHVVESNQRKCRFMAEIAAATNAPVDIHNERIENLSPEALPETPAIVSARALAPLPRLLPLAAPFLRRGSRGLFLKGRDAKDEIDQARKAWTFDVQRHQSLTAPEASVVEVSNLKRRAKVQRSKGNQT